MDKKHDLSVLIVDDNEINLMLMVDILEAIGVQNVKTFESGILAVEDIKNHSTYDAILMDICMPIMDGYEASLAIRNFGYTGRIIALTANGLTPKDPRFLEAKMDDCLLKPVDINELLKVLILS